MIGAQGMRELKELDKLEKKVMLANEQTEDFIRVVGDHCNVKNNYMRDLGMQSGAHRDALQLIPTSEALYHAQYAAGELNFCLIEGNHIEAPSSSLQAITGFDGVFKNIIIKDNIVNNPKAPHGITFNGLLSGFISNNRNSSGVLVPVLLNSIRIGGNFGSGNLWLLNLKNEEYQPLNGLVMERLEPDTPFGKLPHVTDMRGAFEVRRFRNGDKYLIDFDRLAFMDAAKEIQAKSANEFCKKVHKLAFEFGNEFKPNTYKMADDEVIRYDRESH